jgi:hypothetical protein
MGTSEVAKSLEESVPEAESREGGATEAESREGGAGVSPGQDSLPTTVLQASESAAAEAGAPGPAELPDSSFAALNQQCIQHWDRSLGLADACAACAERLRQLRAPQQSLMEWSESGDEAPARASPATADGSLGLQRADDLATGRRACVPAGQASWRFQHVRGATCVHAALSICLAYIHQRPPWADVKQTAR